MLELIPKWQQLNIADRLFLYFHW